MTFKKLIYLLSTLALMISLSFCFEREAYAYADPGSGLLVFQSLSAIFTGGLFYFRKRLRSLVGKVASKSIEKPW